MRNRLTRFGILTLVFVLALSVIVAPSLRAQDDMMKHVCDSTTILLTFVAEYQYGYQPMMDLSTFELGQYAPLFDAMMAMMDEGEMMEDDAMMDDEMMDEMEMMEDMMMLQPPSIADEDPACTELRASVEGFLYQHFVKATMGEMSEG